MQIYVIENLLWPHEAAKHQAECGQAPVLLNRTELKGGKQTGMQVALHELV